MFEENERYTVLQKHVKACRKVLLEHAKVNLCNCRAYTDGTIIITDCLLGRNAQEEYDIAISRLEAYKEELI